MVTQDGIQRADELIERASVIDDLDAAVRLLQDAMGQDDGGLAGIHFSRYEDPNLAWSRMPQEVRITELQLYLDTEQAHIPSDSPAP